MVFKLVIKPIVIFDVEEAGYYYKKKVSGLGKRFITSFYYHFPIFKIKLSITLTLEPVRRYKIESFPYKIFYTFSQDTIYILGVAHAKRNNAHLRRRLRLL